MEIAADLAGVRNFGRHRKSGNPIFVAFFITENNPLAPFTLAFFHTDGMEHSLSLHARSRARHLT